MERYYTIDTEGYRIHCKLYDDDGSAVEKLVLFGHGFGGHKDNRAAEAFAKGILKKNSSIATVTFNWPCHGDDGRNVLRLNDCGRYLEILLADIRERYGSPELYGYGNSFGAYLFLKFMSERGDPFVKTAFRSPAVNMYEVLRSAIMTESDRKRIRDGGTVQVGFDRKIGIDGILLDSLREADIMQRDFSSFADSILILHGTEDEIVPFEAAKGFAEKNGIRFIPVEGGDHRLLNPGGMDFAVKMMLEHFRFE